MKLQPASGTHLPAYNPLLPPPAISQVLLLANPHKVSLGSAVTGRNPSFTVNHQTDELQYFYARIITFQHVSDYNYILIRCGAVLSYSAVYLVEEVLRFFT